MKGQAKVNILEYMNARTSCRIYTYVEVSAISGAIRSEYDDRKKTGLFINGKTDEGKKVLNQRVASIANVKLGRDAITPETVRLYKRCFAEEYTDRTGRCAWGFKEVRRRLGFDENTGMELDEEEIVCKDGQAIEEVIRLSC